MNNYFYFLYNYYRYFMLLADVNLIVKWMKLSKRRSNDYYNVCSLYQNHLLPLIWKWEPIYMRAFLPFNAFYIS